ncbi:MAG TPA: fasciclin domain-containing protein [Candidatus Nanopelagicales bacterium]|jgi:uncharacterized surface protein with fasciclin (FAS1) repeats|nr:fasciclin domain-containing protein [Candidatus Nanopelagicales bacterium]
MITKSRRTRAGIVAAVAVLPFGLAACGGSSSSTAPMSAPTPAPVTSAPAADAASMTFGAGCAAVPMDGAGSFSGMAQDPVATAASNNPALSTLVAAVKAAGLVDSLNSAQGITVFAPTNDAFAKIPAATLKKVLADKATLTKILTYHVVPEQLAPDQLAGDHKTLEGGTDTVTGSGEDFTVNGDSQVVCGNVQTANATVYLVDTVLMPS